MFLILAQLINNNLLQNKANLNLNLSQGQNSSLNSQLNLSNASNTLNTMLNNNNGTNNIALMACLNPISGNNQLQNPNSATPQIQNQLMESFKLAVHSGLISADLLNTKLPQEVLTLVYQLFQTLSLFKASNNKKEALNLRRTQMLPAQFKTEADILNQEIATYKEALITLQAKINNAHAIIKQANNVSTGSAKMSGQLGGNGGSQTPISSSSLVTTPPSSQSSSSIVSGLSNLNLGSLNDQNRTLEMAAANAGVQLNDLPILNNAVQRSKLLQLLSDNNNPLSNVNNKNPLNRQSSQNQNQQMISQQQQQQKQLQSSNSPGNFLQNFPSNNWSTPYKP